MADTEFTIEVQAEGIGMDSTADDLEALGNRIEAADKVITRFDKALEVAGAKLAEQAGAAAKAASALEEAESKYERLERAATKAAKKVEKAAAAGKDTTQLQAAADAAAAAVREQAQVMDRAAAEADAAAAAQKKLARAYRSVEKAASRAAEETRGTQRSFGDLFGAAGALGGPLGGLAGQISGIGDGLRAGGLKGGLILGAFAAGNAFIMWAKAAVGLGLALGGVVAGLLAFAVASDKATSDKLAKAWEKAQKNVKGLFEGVKTEKLVRPVESLLKLLDKNTSAGKGLAKILETLLNPIIDGFDKGEPMIKEFFKGMIIGAQRAIIFVLKLRNSIARAIPKETRERVKKLAGDILSLGNSAKLGGTAFKVLGLVLAALLIPLGLLVALFAMVGVVLVNMVYQAESAAKILGKVGEAIEKATDPANVERNAQKLVQSVAELVGAIYNAIGKLGGKAGEIGQDVWKGLIRGMKSGQGPVAGAAQALAAAILGGISGGLESKSPSRAAERVARTVPQGAIIALRKGEPMVEAAADDLGTAMIGGLQRSVPPSPLSPPRQSMSPAATSSRGGGAPTGNGAQIMLTIGPNGIVVQAPSGDGEDIARTIRRVLLAEVEGAVVQLGAGEVVAGTT